MGPCDEWCEPGAAAALRAVAAFCEGGRLKAFGTKRNDPNAVAASDLSPYLNFGHLSAQRMALIVKEHSRSHNESVASFLEESIVRRELADNFCFYQPHYDSLEGRRRLGGRDAPRPRRRPARAHVHARADGEGKTHEDVWNAAQLQLVGRGKMHGFMRMYWAKKILEWSPTPAEALRRALYLNDKYELDGADPQRLRRLRVVGHGHARHGVGRARGLRQDPLHELQRLQAQVRHRPLRRDVGRRVGRHSGEARRAGRRPPTKKAKK